MSGGNYDVTGNSPCLIFDYPQGDPYTVTNVGSVTVYLGDERNIYPSTGFPLNPGASRVWDAGVTLYAIANPGDTGRVNVSRGSGVVTDPASVASQILTQGLASAIATQISIAGAPAIDSPQILLSGHAVLNATPPGDVFTIDHLNKWQSVSVIIQTTPSYGGARGIFPLRLWVSWHMGGYPVAEKSLLVLTGDDGGMQFPSRIVADLPVLGDSLSFGLEAPSLGGYPDIPIYTQYVVTGSYRSLAAPMVMVEHINATNIPSVWGGGVATTTVAEFQPGVFRHGATVGAGQSWFVPLQFSYPGQTITVVHAAPSGYGSQCTVGLWIYNMNTTGTAALEAIHGQPSNLPSTLNAGRTVLSFPIPESSGIYGLFMINRGASAQPFTFTSYPTLTESAKTLGG